MTGQNSKQQFGRQQKFLQTQGRPGFTLLELVLVVAVISILVWLAVPNFRPVLREARLEQAVKQLQGDLLYARQLAVTSGESQVVFAVGGDASQYAVAASSSTTKVKQLPPGISVEEVKQGGVPLADKRITFNSSGSPGEMDLQVLVGDGRGERAALNVKAVTGRVEVDYQQ